MVIQTKQALALLVAVVLLSTMIAFAVAKATEPEAAAAGGSSKVVKELKKLNKGMGATYKNNSVLGLLSDMQRTLIEIEDNTAEACAEIKGQSSCY